MKKRPILITLLGVTLTCALSYSVIAAETKATLDNDAYVASLRPVYPEPSQQSTNIYGMREMMHCPDGYKFVFEDKNPSCVAMTDKELVGGVQ